MTALYLERYLNFGLSREELQSGKPIVGIAQTGSDLAPCNRHHIELAKRVREGIRDAGGIAMEFPVHPIQETGKRPTAGLDRNLTYLGLVEVLDGYPRDGVVLTIGCDKLAITAGPASNRRDGRRSRPRCRRAPRRVHAVRRRSKVSATPKSSACERPAVHRSGSVRHGRHPPVVSARFACASVAPKAARSGRRWQ